MLDGQHQRVDIPVNARTAHKGLLQKRLEEDICWIIPHVPRWPNQSRDWTKLKWNRNTAETFQKMSGLSSGWSNSSKASGYKIWVVSYSRGQAHQKLVLKMTGLSSGQSSTLGVPLYFIMINAGPDLQSGPLPKFTCTDLCGSWILWLSSLCDQSALHNEWNSGGEKEGKKGTWHCCLSGI